MLYTSEVLSGKGLDTLALSYVFNEQFSWLYMEMHM